MIPKSLRVLPQPAVLTLEIMPRLKRGGERDSFLTKQNTVLIYCEDEFDLGLNRISWSHIT